ncbi:MAG: hypothetical protein KDB61_03780 [Planctomycetes bacterium]|nr:hypothetical protein [Planctomycetota bacterium]
MNLKFIPFAIILALLAAGAYFFSKTDDSTGEGMAATPSGGIAQESQPDQEAELVNANITSSATGPERRVVPESITPEDETQASEAKPNRVTAHIVDERGSALEGVSVWFSDGGHDGPIAIQLGLHKGEPKAKSDETGLVAFHAPEGPFRLWLARPGYVEKVVEIHAQVEAGEDLGTWTLTQALVLTGQVVGPNGSPVPGAKILAPQEGGFLVFMEGDLNAIAETDASGWFQIDTLEPGAWRLMVHSQLYPDRIFSGAASAETHQTGLLWTLTEGNTLRGRVVGRPETSNEELEVSFRPTAVGLGVEALGANSEGFSTPARVVDLAADGTFVVHGLHPDTNYSVKVSEKLVGSPSWFGRSQSLCEPLRVSSNAGTVDLVWSNLAGIHLVVIDDNTSEPIETYRINPGRFDYFESLGGEDHPNGLLEKSNVPPSQDALSLRINSDGYEPYTVEGVTFRAGHVTDLGTIRLKPGRQLKIHVTDLHTGKSVKGARVELTSAKLGKSGMLGEMAGFSLDPLGDSTMHQSGRTDEHGNVALRYMDGSRCKLEVTHSQYADGVMQDIDPANFLSAPLEMALSHGGELIATVLDADQNPVKGVSVKLKPEQGSQNTEIEFNFDGAVSMGEGEFKKATNAAGQAHFKHVPAGRYRCTASWPSSSGGNMVFVFDELGDLGGNEAPEGQLVTIAEQGEAKVTLAAPVRSTLEGIVLENGTPLVGARVTADASNGMNDFAMLFGGEESGVKTDREGRFELDGLEPGKVTVTIHHDLRVMDYTEEIELVEGVNTYRAELQVATVTGRVLDAAGQGMPGIRVSAKTVRGTTTQREFTASIMISGDSGGEMQMISSGTSGRREIMTDADGFYELRGVTPGKPFQVVAEGKELTPVKSDELTLAEGALRSGVNLTMTPASKLTVKVLDPQGAPIAHAMVDVRPVEDSEDPNGGSTGNANNKGIATFDSLPPGTYDVTAFRMLDTPNEEATPTRVTTDTKTPKTIEVRIE